jgi:hypothetical protein
MRTAFLQIIGDGDTPGAIVEQHRPASRRA